jgi:hypothetical protein
VAYQEENRTARNSGGNTKGIYYKDYTIILFSDVYHHLLRLMMELLLPHVVLEMGCNIAPALGGCSSLATLLE